MTEQKPDQGKIEPIGTWSREEPRGGSGAKPDAPTLEPILGAPGVVPLVDMPGEHEPITSPETEDELDRLRRG